MNFLCVWVKTNAGMIELVRQPAFDFAGAKDEWAARLGVFIAEATSRQEDSASRERCSRLVPARIARGAAG